MDEFQDSNKPAKLNQEEINNLEISITNKEIEAVKENLLTKK